MRRTIFDLDVLRTFSTGMELGNFAKAAERLGRSTSAVSAQLKKLEEQAGTPIFRKVGRGLALTDAGETMLGYARRLLELNDEAAAAVNSVELEGWVRLGLQEDFGETLLPDVLGRFARAHPKVRIEARVVRNAELLERVTSGKLDLALAWSDGTLTAHCERIGEVPMRWIGPAEGQPDWQAASGEPMPLASLEAPCLLRSAATKALDEAGISWRLAFVSHSLSAVEAIAAQGLAVTVVKSGTFPSQLRRLSERDGLPPLPRAEIRLHRAQKLTRAATLLADHLVASLAERVRSKVVRRA